MHITAAVRCVLLDMPVAQLFVHLFVAVTGVSAPAPGPMKPGYEAAGAGKPGAEGVAGQGAHKPGYEPWAS